MKNLKRSWNQGLYEVSNSLLEPIGALRILEDGRKFRYARTGSSLAMGIATEGSVLAHADWTVTTLPDIAQWASAFTMTPGNNVTVEENTFKYGYFQQSEGTGLGNNVRVMGSGREVGGTVLPVKLEDGLPVAATTGGGAKGTIFTNDYSYIIIATTITNPVLGVTIIAATAASQYMWVQTGGVACCAVEGTSAIGVALIAHTDNGQLSESAMAATSPIVGHVHAVDNADEKYYPVKLTID